MSFEVSAATYNLFMARYSEQLAGPLADLAEVGPGQRALDVGCGPGALTAVLVRRLGAASVSAVEPSASFAAAVRDRLPGVEVQHAVAQELPFADDSFDVSLAQLVVQFMTDPAAGLREMSRVTRPGGIVAACVWDRGGGRSPTSLFWRAARDLDDSVDDLGGAGAGSNQGELAALFTQAGLGEVRSSELAASVTMTGFEEWWEPLMQGVGPVGDYLLSLGEDHRDRLRARCEELWTAQPATVMAAAWAATGRVP